MAAGWCRKCGRKGNLVKAHVIPRAFYEISPQEDNDVLRLVSINSSEHPKRAPIGVYDKDILCQSCEESFSAFDTFGAQLLLKRSTRLEHVYAPDGDLVGYEIRDYDYMLLKGFFLSILWRASVSTQAFFSLVNLGPLEQKLQKSLEENTYSDADMFACVLFHYDAHPSAALISNPSEERSGDSNIRYYRFKLNRWIVWIKADNRVYDRPIRDLQLSPSPPLIVMCNKFAGSEDHIRALNLARTRHFSSD